MAKRTKQQSSSDDSERVGRKVEYDLSSDTEDDTIKNKPVKKTMQLPKSPRKRDRLALSRRTEIIQNKQRGIDDPEYCCTQNPKTKSWTVRKRKFPLDQTIRHSEPIVPAKKAEIEEAPVVEEEPAPPKKKDDLELTWSNTQARNDKLTDMLAELSAKFDALAEKRERAKDKARIAKAKKLAKLQAKKEKEYEYSYYSDDEPPAPAPAEPQRPPAPTRKLPVGVYRRAGPLSISQF
jgi:hypothetical protein